MSPIRFTRRSLTRRSLAAAALGIVGLAGLMPIAAPAQEVAYPTQTVRLIVPTTPGAGMDTTTRLLADHLSKTWGKPVVVENRPGAGGRVGFNAFRLAKDDPHTLFVSDIGFISILPLIPAPEVIEPRTTLRPVTDMFYTNFVLLARPGRFASLADLLKVAKENPGKLNYGASSPSSGQRLSVELLLAQTDRRMAYIPYAGNAPALNALLAGEIDLVGIGLPPAKPFIESGKLKALAVTSTQRLPALPQVPTVDEAAGIKGYSADAWVGLFAAPSTPDAVVAKIQRDVAAAMKTPELQKFLKTNDYAEGGHSAAAFHKRTEEDRAKYQKLISDLKLTFDN